MWASGLLPPPADVLATSSRTEPVRKSSPGDLEALTWLCRQPSLLGKPSSAQPECLGGLVMAHLRSDQPCLVA